METSPPTLKLVCSVTKERPDRAEEDVELEPELQLPESRECLDPLAGRIEEDPCRDEPEPDDAVTQAEPAGGAQIIIEVREGAFGERERVVVQPHADAHDRDECRGSK